MSAPFSDLFSKAEQAGVALISANAVGTPNVFAGLAYLDKDAPCVICVAEGPSEEEPPFTGNYWLTLNILVKSKAAADDGIDPRPAHELLVATVFDLFLSATLPADLNAMGVVDFSVQGFMPGPMDFAVEEDLWISSLRMRIYCCASTLYP